MKVFFNYALQQRIINQDIVKDFRQLKTDRKPKEFISDRDFKLLLGKIEISRYSEFRDFIIIQLLLDTGMRVGECLSLTVQDLDLKGRAILLRGETTKSKHSRFVYYSQMEKYLRRWVQYKDRYTETDYLFPTIRGTFLAIGNFEKNLNKYGGRVGIKITPQQIRNKLPSFRGRVDDLFIIEYSITMTIEVGNSIKNHFNIHPLKKVTKKQKEKIVPLFMSEYKIGGELVGNRDITFMDHKDKAHLNFTLKMSEAEISRYIISMPDIDRKRYREVGCTLDCL